METGKRVCIIGAGACGLCAARHFSSVSKYNIKVFEMGNQLGGTWCYNDKTGNDEHGQPIHSSMYHSLKTNIPKEIMAFPDFPFPEYPHSFIHHTQVLEYLNSYANHHRLHRFIEYNSKITDIRPLKLTVSDSIVWRVTVQNVVTNEFQVYPSDIVMVCIGRYSCPYIPELPGICRFRGMIIHSHDYRENRRFLGKIVIVLGAGPSGIDIAFEIAHVAKEVIISHNLRPGYTGPLPTNVHQEEGISSILPHFVIFTSGNIHKADAIIMCTGYKLNFPFFHYSCRLMQEHGTKVYPLYKHIINAYHPTFAIIGVVVGILPFPVFNQQVMYYLSVMQGKVKLPSEKQMIDDVKNDFERRKELGIPERHSHKMNKILLWEYDDHLSSAGQFPPISPIVRHLFDLVGMLREQNFMTFKNHVFRISKKTTSKLNSEESLETTEMFSYE